MLGMATQLAQSQGLNDGYRIIINTGRIGHQEVMHLHMHIAGGAQPLGSMLPH
jgi:histidine triad (HIT) family protein